MWKLIGKLIENLIKKLVDKWESLEFGEGRKVFF